MKTKPVIVYAVTCNQGYANFWCLMGVYSTREKAEAEAKKSSDYDVEEMELDKLIKL